MRYTLKDYQHDAVVDVLAHLGWARDDWHERKSPVAFSLTATTGAGKTVMAAAVIETLFNGNPDHNFDSDPGAVVLWFTDDPSLNEQTRFRLMDAADRIDHSRLVVIENTFNQKKLERGKVYFLNAQKLGKKSLLVRGAPERSQESAQHDLPMPDARAFTMWDTLANTIVDEHLTLYLILDEAHRGMKPLSTRDRAEKATIVQRLVNGANDVPPVPIVCGISATVERFNDAMAKAQNRTSYPPVVVDPTRVAGIGFTQGRHPARLPRRCRSVRHRFAGPCHQKGETSHGAVARLRAAGRRSHGGGGAAPGRASAKQAVGPTPPVGVRHDPGDLAGTRTGRNGARVRRTRPDRARRVHGPARRPRDGAGSYPHPRAVR